MLQGIVPTTIKALLTALKSASDKGNHYAETRILNRIYSEIEVLPEGELKNDLHSQCVEMSTQVLSRALADYAQH